MAAVEYARFPGWMLMKTGFQGLDVLDLEMVHDLVYHK